MTKILFFWLAFLQVQQVYGGKPVIYPFVELKSFSIIKIRAANGSIWYARVTINKEKDAKTSEDTLNIYPSVNAAFVNANQSSGSLGVINIKATDAAQVKSSDLKIRLWHSEAADLSIGPEYGRQIPYKIGRWENQIILGIESIELESPKLFDQEYEKAQARNAKIETINLSTKPESSVPRTPLRTIEDELAGGDAELKNKLEEIFADRRAEKLESEAIAAEAILGIERPRKPFILDTPIPTIIAKLSESNPNVRKLLSELLSASDSRNAFVLGHLDSMNMRGLQVWIAFNDFAKGDKNTFLNALRSQSTTMIEFVNRAMGNRGFSEKAVAIGDPNARVQSDCHLEKLQKPH